jgi:hypothetical protein
MTPQWQQRFLTWETLVLKKEWNVTRIGIHM